jgi:hypothetical protein
MTNPRRSRITQLVAVVVGVAVWTFVGMALMSLGIKPGAPEDAAMIWLVGALVAAYVASATYRSRGRTVS